MVVSCYQDYGAGLVGKPLSTASCKTNYLTQMYAALLLKLLDLFCTAQPYLPVSRSGPQTLPGFDKGSILLGSCKCCENLVRRQLVSLHYY